MLARYTRQLYRGVTRFGIFAELKNTIEGMIPLARLDDDYYEYYEKRILCDRRTYKKTDYAWDKISIKGGIRRCGFRGK